MSNLVRTANHTNMGQLPHFFCCDVCSLIWNNYLWKAVDNTVHSMCKWVAEFAEVLYIGKANLYPEYMSLPVRLSLPWWKLSKIYVIWDFLIYKIKNFIENQFYDILSASPYVHFTSYLLQIPWFVSLIISLQLTLPPLISFSFVTFACKSPTQDVSNHFCCPYIHNKEL